MEIQVINSDAGSNEGSSYHDFWLSRGIAVTSGVDKYRRALERIKISDVLALHANGVGVVAVGVPLDDQTFDVSERSEIISPRENLEYHRRVQWLLDLRAQPISVEELRSLGAPPTPHAVRRVVNGKSLVAARFANLLDEAGWRAKGKEELVLTLQKLAAGVSPKLAPRFQTGRVYDRKTEINGPFGGSWQSGIAPSNVSAAIFLFTGESGAQYGYSDSDGFDSDGGAIFSYTGEGQIGDMEFTAGNRAVLEHGKDGRALHLFRSLGKGKGQRYLGEFVYASHRLEEGPDKNGNLRQLIIFQLVQVEAAAVLESMNSMEEDAVQPSEVTTLEEARSLAIAAASGGGATSESSAIRTLYKRSRAVRDYVLMRATGECESCKKPAPFARLDGTPYLEPHHTTRLSDGGVDHPKHVGAVCPACHREIHYGKHGAARNAELQAYLFQRESEK